MLKHTLSYKTTLLWGTHHFKACYCPMLLLFYTVGLFRRVVYQPTVAPISLPIFSSAYYSKTYTTTSSSFKHHQWTAHCQIHPWIFNSYLTGTICSIYNLSLKYFLALFLGIPGCLYLLSISSDHSDGSHLPYFPNTLLSLSISKHWSSQELVFRL